VLALDKRACTRIVGARRGLAGAVWADLGRRQRKAIKGNLPVERTAEVFEFKRHRA
jgi:hypothetical protein